VKLIAFGAQARHVWQDALPDDPSAVVFQTPEWLDCICAVSGHVDATRAYAAPDGRRLVLPLAQLGRLPPRARIAGSMPWGWGTGGLISTGRPLQPHDVAAVAADLAATGALRIAVRPGPAANDAWAAGVPPQVTRTQHMVQIVDLAGGFDRVSGRFSASVRRACAKAERSGLDVECDDTGRLAGVFDSLYRASVARWAQHQRGGVRLAQWRARLREPRRKFEVVSARMGPACRVWVASRAGAPAAAIIVLSHGEHSTYWRGAMDKEVEAGTRANDLLHRLAIEDACRSGRRFYHMGESAPGSSLARFKRGFGAAEHHYVGYRFERVPVTAIARQVRQHVVTVGARARRP
jgi:Acetyltransferase (GNAT) domain